MAKQTFTTGQVLTAAQMTSLQQTAMGGGSATAKTASYTLVAADAGATVIMNSASATTITVNTSLFSAGDTVFIQNIGAGISTITAGTATVNTASSLALAQYESGSLYFTAAGASIFSKADGAAAASASGLNLISTTTWSGAASQSFNSVFTSIYTNYRLIINVNDPTSDGTVRMRLRVSGTDNTGANYMSVMDGMRSDGVRSSFVSSADTSFLMSEIDAGTAGNRYGYSVDLFKPQTNTLKTGQVVNEGMTTAGLVYSVYGGLTFTTAIQADGFTLFTSAGNFSGTCSIYGYGI